MGVLDSLGIKFLGEKMKFYLVELDILRQHKNKSIDYWLGFKTAGTLWIHPYLNPYPQVFTNEELEFLSKIEK